MKSILILLFSCFASVALMAKEVTVIKGYAPKYIGKQVEIYQTADYISMTQVRIASATVEADSTFTCSFFLKETQKLTVVSNNNKGTIICEPGGSYEIFMPDRNPYDPYRPAGNLIELTFFNMDSTNINYKVLQFNQWTDQFIATYYTKNNTDGPFFSQRLDTFKLILQDYYKADTLNTYFNYHRRFTIAKIDDLRFLGSRNQYEKYDFYIKNTPVVYESEAYMEYIKHYYDKFMPRVNMNTNNKVYLALLKSSPTLIMRALASEYTMQHNFKLREMMMIKILSESFYDKEYPQTNILTVLDSLQKKSAFEGNRIIAENIYKRLTELTAGGKAPDFTVVDNGTVHDLQKYKGKFLYVFFVKPGTPEINKQLDLLVPIFHRYSKNIQFLMVIRDDGTSKPDELKTMKAAYPWESVVVGSNHSILTNYQIVTYPIYILIDPIGYVVAAPALGPLPNGQYETIDQTFFKINKAIEEGASDGR
ncbi:MAG: hypothetical protein IT221_07135 [Fluviicola sp.]|nr:hypothetical protein [Fluviicola sp.]